MRSLALILLIACLVQPVLAHTPGRGLMAGWAELNGSWDGVGTDPDGEYQLHADVETLFGGQFVLIQTRETRGDQVRENITVFTGGEAPGAYIYAQGAPHVHLNGFVDADTGQIFASGAKVHLSWYRGEDGTLDGFREEPDSDGNLQPHASWSLKRTSPTGAPREATRPGAIPRATVRGEVEYFEFMDGTLKGDGLQAIKPGQMAAEHFEITQVNSGALSDTLLLTRETRKFDSGRTEASFQIHQVQNGAPVRHDFQARGVVLEYTGEFNDIAQMRLNIELPAGKLQIAVVATCSGFKTVNELTRPGLPPVWVGEMQIKKAH